jgi:hypothetical protein
MPYADLSLRTRCLHLSTNVWKRGTCVTKGLYLETRRRDGHINDVVLEFSVQICTYGRTLTWMM